MRENTLKAVRICLLVLAITLIIHGIFNGSMRDVLFKAVRICTECIGLG
ncbi:MAG: thioredoxin [Oscillospiraceae bacterium]|nr:thioredoxin [Oscillospiraceae bacterium]MBQ6215004.1 thioredoxin [Oscillospiraceae bacterium]